MPSSALNIVSARLVATLIWLKSVPRTCRIARLTSVDGSALNRKATPSVVTGLLPIVPNARPNTRPIETCRSGTFIAMLAILFPPQNANPK